MGCAKSSANDPCLRPYSGPSGDVIALALIAVSVFDVAIGGISAPVITESNARQGERGSAVAHAVLGSLIPLTLAAISLTAPTGAEAAARDPQPSVHLIRTTRTTMRLGWPAARAARSFSYRLIQMNGKQVRAGSGPGSRRTITLTGLHPRWRYRFVLRINPAAGPARRGVLYVTLPGPVPPRERAYKWAESQAGTPYVYGAQGNGGYDCSGLVRTAYQHAGIWLPRTTYQMLSYGKLRRESRPRQGDLVFFGTGHVELYDRQDWSFGAESSSTGSSWYRWWPGNWWPTAFYRVHGAN